MAKGKTSRGSRTGDKARRAAYLNMRREQINAGKRADRHKKRLAADAEKKENIVPHGTARAKRRLAQGISKIPARILGIDVEAKSITL